MNRVEPLKTLLRGVVDLHTREELEARLNAGRPLRVKLGVDPTFRDLHLGHTVVLRKLRQFQELGHEAILLIGDFTGLVGDPSGRSRTRPPLSPEELEANARTYLEQVAAVLDIEKLRVVRNSEWLSPLTFRDLLRWTSHMTVARILERDDFATRHRQGNPIHLHEFLYVFMQAYDSVALKADIELGGRDQLFNLLAGRDLMRADGQAPQIAMTVPLLVGTDGRLKMSKSYGNHIGITEEPYEMFSKVMSVADHVMPNWFTLLTDLPEAEIESLCDGSKTHPRDAKLRLAREITAGYHGPSEAEKAAARWEAEKSRGEVPEDVPDFRVPPEALDNGAVLLVPLLRRIGLVSSNSEARRLIQQGGVVIGGRRVTDPTAPVPIRSGALLRVGKKKRYFRLLL